MVLISVGGDFFKSSLYERDMTISPLLWQRGVRGDFVGNFHSIGVLFSMQKSRARGVRLDSTYGKDQRP